MGREPIVNAPYLTLGTLIHQALDDWAQTPSKPLTLLFQAHANVALEDIIERYRNRIGAEISGVELAPITEAITLGYHMVANYAQHYKTPLPPGWTLYASEREFELPIPGTTHTLCGKLDKTLIDAHGRLYVADIKTYSQQPSDEAIQFNPQFLLYTLALKLLYPSVETVGFAFDGLRKRQAPAKGKDISDLFYRNIFYRTDAELEEAYENLTIEAFDMEHANIYPNRQWDCHITCASAFRELCRAESRGEDVEYLKGRLTAQRQSAEEVLEENLANS